MSGDGVRAGAAVEGRGLVKRYGDFTAVDGIDFRVEPRECFGFLGPNGAGKTTTMKMIYGLAAIDGGELRVLGLDARTRRREVKALIGVVPQEGTLDNDLSVRGNLEGQALYHGLGSPHGRIEDPHVPPPDARGRAHAGDVGGGGHSRSPRPVISRKTPSSEPCP